MHMEALLPEEKCRDCTNVAVKATCGVEEPVLSENALRWPLWKQDWCRGGLGRKRSGVITVGMTMT